VKLRDVAFGWLRDGYCTVIKSLFVCSFGVVMLSLKVDPLKLTVAAQELKEPLPLISLLVTPDCDVIEPIEDVTASKDFTWPIRTPNKSIAFRMVVRLLFISVIGVTIQAGLGIGLGIGLRVNSGVVLLSI
jgi:hypothetical protein